MKFVGDVICGFGKDRNLFQIIGQFRIEGRINRPDTGPDSRRSAGTQGRVNKGVITGGWQKLLIETVGVGIENSGYPLQGPVIV